MLSSIGFRSRGGTWGYYAIGALLLLVVAAAFLAGTGGVLGMLTKAGWGGAISLIPAVIMGCVIAYAVAKLIGLLVRLIGSGSFVEWHQALAARWNARMQDHRLVMVGAGVATLLVSIALFGTLSTSFFPPENSDYSRVNITLAPGSTLEETEAVTDRVAEIVKPIRTSTACSRASRSERPT